MEITEKLLDDIEVYGSRNYPVNYIMHLECRTDADREFLKMEFDNPTSAINLSWLRGFVKHENEVDEYLEKALENPGEGANDIARALHFRRKNRRLDDIKNELFGL